MELADTPPPPYYAVIFSSVRNYSDTEYLAMAKKMEDLARVQPGFLGFESVGDLMGISVSYWKTLDSIKEWKSNVAHLEAQDKGKAGWYKSYKVRIAKVEKEYSFN